MKNFKCGYCGLATTRETPCQRMCGNATGQIGRAAFDGWVAGKTWRAIAADLNAKGVTLFGESLHRRLRSIAYRYALVFDPEKAREMRRTQTLTTQERLRRSDHARALARSRATQEAVD